MTSSALNFTFPFRDLLGIEGLSASDITNLLDLADTYVDLNRQIDKKTDVLRGRTQINLFLKVQPARKARLSWPANGSARML